MIKEIKGLGFDTIELNFALPEHVVKDILLLKEKGEIKVSSLHNMCPLPSDIDPKNASPDFYSLSSPDETQRRRAVEIAKNTIRFAGMFDAKAVVLHAGRVETKDRTRQLPLLSQDPVKYGQLKSDIIEERAKIRGPFLDSVLKSLSELVPFAKDSGIRLGVENRYYYREIPILDEFEIIFKNFKPGDLYYWHDVGHAEVFERLGFYRHRDLLERFSNRLIGVHLHDIIGFIDDHKAPGFGTFNFKNIKSYIKKDTIKVIEAHKPATADEIRESIEYLMRSIL